MQVFCLRVCICTTQGQCLQGSQEGITILEMDLINGGEPPCGCWNPNPGPLHAQQVFLILSYLYISLKTKQDKTKENKQTKPVCKVPSRQSRGSVARGMRGLDSCLLWHEWGRFTTGFLGWVRAEHRGKKTDWSASKWKRICKVG